MSDDDYGETWEYRVLSWINTNPDEMPGRRILSICRVYYKTRPVLWPNPGDDDVIAIDEDGGPLEYTTEQMMLALHRMQAALDKPVLIRSEWEKRLMRRVPQRKDTSEPVETREWPSRSGRA